MSEANEHDALTTLQTITLHVRLVQQNLRTIARELEARADAHDTSKLLPDEFDGFTRINRTAREHAYGSPQYRAAMKAEKATLDLHFARNPHHPEHWPEREPAQTTPAMQLPDLIEMVCDWHAAWTVCEAWKPPGRRSRWHEAMEKQRLRFRETEILDAGQWAAVQLCAALFDSHEPIPDPPRADATPG